MRPDQHNIYRDKRHRRNNKNTSKAVVSAVLTVVLVGGVVFLGYKIGEPLIGYLDNAQNGNSTSNVDNLMSTNSLNSDNTTLDSSSSTNSSDASSNILSNSSDSVLASITESGANSSSNNSIKDSSSTASSNSNKDSSSTSSSSSSSSKSDSKKDNSSSSSQSSSSSSSTISKDDGNTDFHTDGNYVAPGSKDGTNTNSGNTANNNTTTTPTYTGSSTFNGYTLNVGDLKDVNTLNKAIKNAGSKGTFKNIVVPLKLSGGKVYYKSSVSGAIRSGAVSGTLTLSEIVNAITSQGYTPVAEISTLEDKTYSMAYADAGYSFADGTSHWYDNSVEKGGKPWLSPQSDLTKQYLTQLVAEITSSGFKSVICSDVNYPNFRTSDLDLIGDSVKSATRYKALINLVNELNTTAIANNARLMVRIPAKYIINGTAEIIKPTEFPKNVSIMPFIGYDDISSDMYNNTIKLIQNSQAKCGADIDIIPCINAGGKDVSKAISALQSVGYSEYIIK